MKIKFKQLDDQTIAVIGIEQNEEKQVGTIFTPSGRSRENKSAIQVCGFEEAFDLWGCSIYSEAGNPDRSKKDVQLYFNWKTDKNNTGYNVHSDCEGCFSKPCICENEWSAFGNPFKVKREEELFLNAL